MNVLRRAAVLLIAAMGVVWVAGCSPEKTTIGAIANVPPTVRVTAAPIDSNAVCSPGQAHSCYSLTLDWVGYDVDGRVDHYIYAIDPPADGDTTWITTTDHEKRLTFDAPSIAPNKTHADDSLSVLRGYHVFVVAAVDDKGVDGPRVFRAFFSFTNAPTVDITRPRPQGLVPQLPPSVRISWQGRDSDGIFSDKPTSYRYLLLGPADAARINEIIITKGDAIRKYYAPEFRADQGWVTVGGETTSVQITDLIPAQNDKYLFAVAAFDEAGAFSPVFSFQHNILQFRVGFANTNGPSLTVFNESFFYQFPPRYDPLAEVRIEVPAGQQITFNWAGTPPEGADIVAYRWMLDGDVFDTHPRSDENTDFIHWSTPQSATTTATFGPFQTAGDHFFYVDVVDNTGLKSLAVIHFSVVVPTFDKPLLIVDDTRYEPDMMATDGQTQIPYGYQWPAAAELDTFMYAIGGVPWQRNDVAGTPVLSTPGIFHGYQFDTLGTRKGLSELTVSLATLGQYQHVIWLVDQASALMSNPGSVTVMPATSLRYMSASGHLNSLGAFIRMGGSAWVMGGGGAMATLIAYNVPANDGGGGRMVWSSVNGTELRAGRFMYDAAKWQSAIFDRVGISMSNTENITIVKSLGRFKDNPGIYADVPIGFNKRNVNTDPVPPRRTNASFFVDKYGGEVINAAADNIIDEPVFGEPRDFRIDKFDDPTAAPVIARWPSSNPNIVVTQGTVGTTVGRASGGTLHLATPGSGAATGGAVSHDFGNDPRDLSGLERVLVSLKQSVDTTKVHWKIRLVDTQGASASAFLDPVNVGQFGDLAVEARFFSTDPGSPLQPNFVRIKRVEFVCVKDAGGAVTDFDNLEFTTVPDGAVLDTLLAIRTNGVPLPTMTIYHGKDFAQPVIFTGFAPWDFRRNECQRLIDFVLQKVWGLPKSASASYARPSLASFAPAHRSTAVQATRATGGAARSTTPGLRRSVPPRREGNP